MSGDKDEQLLGAFVSDAQERSACPPAELLARAAAGEADAGERRAIVDHLASCASCSDEYRTAVALGPWARVASDDAIFGDSATRTAVTWRLRTFAYAATVLLAVGTAVALAAWSVALRAENARLTAALANRDDDSASPPAAPDAGQSQVIAELQGKLAAATTPSVNVPIVDLLPRDAVRGSVSPTLPRVPASAQSVTFVITTAANPTERDHELEIVDASGSVRWRGGGLHANAERTFTATVPGALMSAGTCHVRLYERRDGGPRLVADYSIVVQ